MINGGHDNSLQIFEEDHQWRKGIFQRDSQGTAKSPESDWEAKTCSEYQDTLPERELW